MYRDKYVFHSKFTCPYKIVPAHYDLVLSIGMCHLLWYWMGFGTEYICIESHDLSDNSLKFWETFYNEILLEFKYQHPSVNNVKVIKSRSTITVQLSSTPLFDINNNNYYKTGLNEDGLDSKKVLVPLGGKNKFTALFFLMCVTVRRKG
jgi:hypothetical protein